MYEHWVIREMERQQIEDSVDARTRQRRSEETARRIHRTNDETTLIPQPARSQPPGSAIGQFCDVCLATADAYCRRALAYTIDIIRGPVYPLLYYAVLLLTYRVAGRATVDGMSAEGFLLVGIIGIELWQGNLWASGYAIETERHGGTLPALLLSPASRSAVVIGYALGSIIINTGPSLLVIAPVAVLSGARFDIADPAAVIVASASLALASVALGYGLAGLFVLTHRANLLANFLQSPIYLLSGMVVPISALPGPLHFLAEIFPISFGMTALRQSLLTGANLGDLGGTLLRVIVSSVAMLVIGSFFLRRVEHVAKRGAELDYI